MSELDIAANPDIHQIVIVGGGAGGLVLATKLGRRFKRLKAQAKVTLVDQSLTHLWKPRLHEVAAGTIDSFEDELNYVGHAAKNNFEFQLGSMHALDTINQQVVLSPVMDGSDEIIPERTIAYNQLIIAIGSTSNDFATPGAREHCVFLDNRNQAEVFHKRLLNTYLTAHADQPIASASADHEHALNIAIVGAGATGVELAAELYEAAQKLARYGLREIRPENVHITIIEAADRVLPALAPNVSQAALIKLEKLGVQVCLNERVTEVTATHLATASGKLIPASLKVWSAGIQAPAFLKDLGLQTNPINQIIVNPQLKAKGFDNIYAFGDCASLEVVAGMRIPPRAQVAYQQAKYLAQQMIKVYQGQPTDDFDYKDYGSLVSVSSHSAVGNLMGGLFGSVSVHGFFAYIMYVSLYRLHQRSLHGTFRMLLMWMQDVLSRSNGPKLKLH